MIYSLKFRLRPAAARAVFFAALFLTYPCSADDEKTRFSEAEQVLRAAIEASAFPGCSVAVGTSDRILWSSGLGHFCYDSATAREIGLKQNPKVTTDTLYDLASLSKVVGTTSVVMTLIQEDRLTLATSVSEAVPEFGSTAERQQVTVEHLLTHSSGLPAWKAFYRTAEGPSAVLKLVAATPLETPAGARYRYSDLGFMLLGRVAAEVGEGALDQLERDRVFRPLKMRSTFRRPALIHHSRIAPTERDPESSELVHGIVHDENCRAAGGVTGHAGLFSNVTDLSLFAQEMLRALKGKGTVFSQRIAQQFVARRNLVVGSSRALGWDTPSGRSSGGSQISRTAFGHTGFTGTSLWIDPQRDAFVILLTNRVHPSRKNSQISGVRRALADAVWKSVDEIQNRPQCDGCDF